MDLDCPLLVIQQSNLGRSKKDLKQNNKSQIKQVVQSHDTDDSCEKATQNYLPKKEKKPLNDQPKRYQAQSKCLSKQADESTRATLVRRPYLDQ